MPTIYNAMSKTQNICIINTRLIWNMNIAKFNEKIQ